MMEQCQPLCRLLLCKRFATAFRPFSPNKCEPEIPQLTFVRTFYFLHSEVQNLLSLFLFFYRNLYMGILSLHFKRAQTELSSEHFHPHHLPEIPAL